MNNSTKNAREGTNLCCPSNYFSGKVASPHATTTTSYHSLLIIKKANERILKRKTTKMFGQTKKFSGAAVMGDESIMVREREREYGYSGDSYVHSFITHHILILILFSLD